MRFIKEYYNQRLKTVYYSDNIYQNDTQNARDEYKQEYYPPRKIWIISQTASHVIYTRSKPIPSEHTERSR